MPTPPKPPTTSSRLLRDIFAIMDRRGVSRDSVAHALNANRDTISHYRHDVHLPGILRVEEIAELLGCEIALEPIGEEPVSRPREVKLTASRVLRALFEKMEDQGLNMSAVARRVSSQPNAIQSYRRGQKEPRVTFAEKLAETLGYRLVLRPRKGK